MKVIASIAVLGLTYWTAVFADGTPTIDTEVPIEQQIPVFENPLLDSPKTTHRYYSVSLSGLTHRYANFEVGIWERHGNNSYVSAFKQIYMKDLVGILGSWQYRRHIDPLNVFELYLGLGIDAGFIFQKERPAVMRVMPIFSIGKIISQTEEATQFLEIRTNLPSYNKYFSYPVHGWSRLNFNYSIYYGVSF